MAEGSEPPEQLNASPDRPKRSRDRVGDEVLVKEGPWKGERATVVARARGWLRLELRGGLGQFLARPHMVLNYSRRSRRAWQTCPHRKVGRKKGSGTVDRVNVCVRLDRAQWERFQELYYGKAASRIGELVRGWIDGAVEELERQRSPQGA